MTYEYVLINTTNSNTMGVYETLAEAQEAILKLETVGMDYFIIRKRVKGN